jgi:hypothetical protein
LLPAKHHELFDFTFSFFFFFAVLEMMEPRASSMLGRCSAELHSQALVS